MGSDLDVIARELVAHPDWRWAPGMRRLDQARMLDACADYGLLWAHEEQGTWWTDPDKTSNFTPDLTDRATVLLVADWARGLWIAAGASYVITHHECDGVAVLVPQGEAVDEAFNGPTLAHAALAAARAAKERSDGGECG